MSSRVARYVDRFYAVQGYEPWAVLVRTPADVPPDPPDPQSDTLEARIEAEVRKRYVDAEGAEFGFVEEVREAFDDDEAVFSMQKSLSR